MKSQDALKKANRYIIWAILLYTASAFALVADVSHDLESYLFHFGTVGLVSSMFIALVGACYFITHLDLLEDEEEASNN